MRLVLFALLACAIASGQSASQAARGWHSSRSAQILEEFRALLAIPNVARVPDDMRRNADFITAMYARRGVMIERLNDVLFGEIKSPGAARTILFYAHYDGQPVELSEWKVTQPFVPVIRDGRVWARSASDDKAPILALATALDALREAKIPLHANIKFFFDGEEEAGSPHIGETIDRYKAKLGADVWLFCDGPVHQSRRQQVVFGARGSSSLQVTVLGPVRELHSGHYGNWSPNPAMMLAQLLASMQDEETGKVLIKDFYKDTEPLSAAEQRAIAEAPNFDAEIRKELGLNRTLGDGQRLDELVNRPALNIQGIQSAGVGKDMRNVIPDAATAGIGLRMAKGDDYRRLQDRVIEHIRSRGYHVVDAEPDMATRLRYPRICIVARRGGYNGVRAPLDSEIARRVLAAVESAHGPVVKLPTMGGSLPIAPIFERMGAPVIIVPIANHDNNQHGHNENIRLENLWNGIETMAALLAME
jgi:acetylornithine deacetylase/succinyl-diaminopimelate desuccinylase-like protein